MGLKSDWDVSLSVLLSLVESSRAYNKGFLCSSQWTLSLKPVLTSLQSISLIYI